MKVITIRLPAMEGAMLVEVQKVDNSYKNLQSLLINQICKRYAAIIVHNLRL